MIRQQNINFEWELIIAEENIGNEFLGRKFVMQYKKRLEAVGCTNLHYIGLQRWMPLANKRSLLIKNCSKSSKIIVGSPADYYSAPLRISVANKIFKEHPNTDWVIPSKVLIYDIRTKKIILRTVRKGRRRNDVIGSSIRAKYLKKAAPDIKVRRRGVDALVWMMYKKAKGSDINLFIEESDNWKYALNTTGLNNLTNRRSIFANPRRIYQIYNYKLSKILPKEAALKLAKCHRYLGIHKRAVLGKDR